MSYPYGLDLRSSFVISLIKSFVNRTNRISVEQYNIEIDAAEARISQGLCISHEEIEKESKEW